MVPVRDFGRAGLIADRGSWNIPLQGLDIAENSAFYDGRIGSSNAETVKKEVENDPPAFLGVWRQENQNTLLGISRTGVASVVGSASTSRIIPAPAEGTTDAHAETREFQILQSGTSLIIFPSTDNPKVLSAIGTDATDLANWPDGLRADAVAKFNNHIFVGGLDGGEGSTRKSVIRWSNFYDESTEVPSTWVADTTNTAGEIVLPQEYGPIVAMEPMEGRLWVYTSRAVYYITPGNQVVGFIATLKYTDDGAINRRAVVETEKGHLVVGTEDIYLNDGQTKRSIVDKRIRRSFFSSLKDKDSVFIEYSPERSEVVVAYGDSTATSGQANKAYRYEIRQDAWTHSTFISPILDLARGAVKLDIDSTTFDSDVGTFDESTETYSSQVDNPVESQTWASVAPAGATPGGFSTLNSRVRIEQADTDYAERITLLRHSHLDFDKEIGGGTNKILQVNRILPQVEGHGTVFFRVGGRLVVNGDITWSPRVPYRINEDYKVDVRVSGRYLVLQVEMEQGEFILDGIDFDITVASDR